MLLKIKDNNLSRSAQANIASKNDIANFVKKIDFDDKLKNFNKNVTSNKTKQVLVENELNELSQKFEAILTKGLTKDLVNGYKILNGAKYFSSGIFQNYLVFITAKKHNKHFSGTTRINSWNSNGMSEENIESVTKSESNFAPTFVDHHVLPDIKFNGYCLINNNISIPKIVVNLSISYILNLWLRNLNTDFTLNNCLFESAELTNNANLDK